MAQQQEEEIALLKDEVCILKGEKKRPIFKPSKLDKNTELDRTSKPPSKNAPDPAKRKRPKTW